MKIRISRKTFALVLAYLLLAGILFFIFSHSVASREESSAESNGVLEIVEPVLQAVLGDSIEITDHLIRKIAHFAEFGALGADLCLISLLHGQKPGKNTLLVLFAGVLTAMTDETIQIFSQRGSQVQDVWLDSAGALTGILGMLLFYRIYKKSKRNGRHKREK